MTPKLRLTANIFSSSLCFLFKWKQAQNSGFSPLSADHFPSMSFAQREMFTFYGSLLHLGFSFVSFCF